eukprot:765309-Hanusia_phi.AAC.4
MRNDYEDASARDCSRAPANLESGPFPCQRLIYLSVLLLHQFFCARTPFVLVLTHSSTVTVESILTDYEQGWEVERLLWLAVCKGEATQLHKVAKVMGSDAAAASSDVSCYRQQQRQCHMNMLQPSMIRRIMKHFVLLGGLQHGCTCE